MCQQLGMLNIFHALKYLEKLNWKKNKKKKKLEYRFLVQSTTNKSAAFLYKTTLPKVNVKTTYHKEWTFATDYFAFFENLIWV